MTASSDERSLYVRVAAEPDFVVVLRLVARSAASFADLTLDDIEGVELAVDEAAALLLPLTDPGHDLTLSARMGHRRVEVSVATHTVDPSATIDESGLAWRTLKRLDPEVTVTRREDQLTIAVSHEG